MDKQMGVMQGSVLKTPICDRAEQSHISRVWDIVEKVRVGMLRHNLAGDCARGH